VLAGARVYLSYTLIFQINYSVPRIQFHTRLTQKGHDGEIYSYGNVHGEAKA
jgi:hypothetical protein